MNISEANVGDYCIINNKIEGQITDIDYNNNLIIVSSYKNKWRCNYYMTPDKIELKNMNEVNNIPFTIMYFMGDSILEEKKE